MVPTTIAAAAVAVGLLGCAGMPDPDGALRVDAFDADGRTETPDVLADLPDARTPILLSFEAGDVIEPRLVVDAPELFETLPDGRLRVRRSFELMGTRGGIALRTGGDRFERPRGSMHAEMLLSPERRTNEALVRIEVRAD